MVYGFYRFVSQQTTFHLLFLQPISFKLSYFILFLGSVLLFSMPSGFHLGLTLSKDISGRVSSDCVTFLFCIPSFDSSFLLMRCCQDFMQVLFCPKTFLARFPQTELLSCSASFLPILTFPQFYSFWSACSFFHFKSLDWQRFAEINWIHIQSDPKRSKKSIYIDFFNWFWLFWSFNWLFQPLNWLFQSFNSSLSIFF